MRKDASRARRHSAKADAGNGREFGSAPEETAAGSTINMGPKSLKRTEALERLRAKVREQKKYRQAHAQLNAEIEELRGYKRAHDALKAEAGKLRRFKGEYEKLNAEVGQLQGYKNAYDELKQEAARLRRYKAAYEKLNAEVGELRGYRDACDTLAAEKGKLRSYKEAYERLNAEVGALRGYRDAYAKLKENRAISPSLPDIEKRQGRRREVARKPASRASRPSALFAVIANGRTGSTWLQTTLDQLPDVRTRAELKLKLAYQAPHPLHVYLDWSTSSVEECIEQACVFGSAPSRRHRVRGSKLILDPYGYLEPRVFDFLGKLFTPEIRIVFLKRDYISQFYSWKIRGVYHEVNEETASRIKSLDPTLIEVITQWDEPEITTIVLTNNNKPLLGAAAEPGGRVAKRYPLRDAVEDLLVLFYNDLNILRLANQSRHWMMIDYEEIEPRFAELVGFLGSRASEEEACAVLRQPLTKRLTRLDPELLQPPGALDAFSDCLERALDAAAARGLTEDIWQWRREREMIELAVPGLRELLDRHGLAVKRPESADGTHVEDRILWRRQRPFYGLQDR